MIALGPSAWPGRGPLCAVQHQPHPYIRLANNAIQLIKTRRSSVGFSTVHLFGDPFIYLLATTNLFLCHLFISNDYASVGVPLASQCKHGCRMRQCRQFFGTVFHFFLSSARQQSLTCSQHCHTGTENKLILQIN